MQHWAEMGLNQFCYHRETSQLISIVFALQIIDQFLCDDTIDHE